MIKRISLVLASITLAVGCSYFLTGKLIQKNYYETIAKINSQSNIKVDLLSYNRGLFHSTADLTVELGADNLSDAQIISLKQVITHGPVIAANTPTGHSVKLLAGQIKTSLGQPLQQRLEEFTTRTHPLSIVTLINFSNKATTWLRMTDIDQTTPTQFHVAWDPINGLIEHDLNFANYHGNIVVPNFVMNSPSWKFQIKNLVLNLDANNDGVIYSNSNTMTTQNLTFTKDTKDVIKLDAISAKLAFFNKDNSLALDLEAKVDHAQIVDQQFTYDIIKLQANNINRATLGHLPNITALSPKATIDILQQLTVESTQVTLELPKHFTEALISYVSFEIYRTSYLGKFDNRPPQTVLQDITGSINKLVQGAVQQQLFLDKGDYYALNFNRPAQG